MSPTDSTAPLTAEEKQDRDRLVEAARYALDQIRHHGAEFGRHVRELRDRRLYREDGLTWEDFVSATFERSASWAYQFIEMADVCDDLDHEGVDRITTKSHARDLVQLPPERRAGALERARDIAEGEEVPLAARHIATACNEVRAAGDTTATVGPQDSAERVAVRTYDGLLVAFRAALGDELDGALARLPRYALVPYAEGTTWSEPFARVVDAFSFARANLDDWTDLTWPVLVSDPWATAESWSTPDGPFRATFYPDRLSSPRSRADSKATDRERTVLVAPGVDVLHEAVPDPVLRAVVDAAGADSGRHYVVLTRNAARVWDGWPSNVIVAVEASGTASAVADAARALHAAPAFGVLVVRDLTEPVKPGDLDGVGVALVRGQKTRQEGYDALRTALGSDRVDIGRETKVRHAAYLPVQSRTTALTTHPPPTGLRTVPPQPAHAVAA